MDTTELADMHKSELVDLLHVTQHIMQGFTRTVRLVSVAITSDELDGADLTRQAAEKVVEMLIAEAVEKRDAGEIGEAEVRGRAIEHFRMLIDETLRPSQPQQ
ncbi:MULTISPECIES: hypothetical protein [unclassified Bosea (in: a-proteobacteria)]|uniref:hypothetical protein n=1 Tax=unclassified Bosea (in: a-proteobacteria) TaxID=2653178 RepID=UPI000F755405|nr:MULTISPECIES: hypothetical protein [unclassified Bosea (in: a-proteobacteria)]AZO82109.1 hypothetical protein BLM15_30475 [Bosea sp. Tri-49]RXT24686.1 hypothetical protein B5U98_08600 [Bosea sp. Tri-39]RXT42521.1 hypothetical protein B5U99_01070 [Bosea sp. Tri-54]